MGTETLAPANIRVYTDDMTSDLPCVCVVVRKASRRLTARYDASLAPTGLTLAQFSLLRNIRRHGPVSLTALGDIVELDRSTLGRNVRLLERMELVAPASGDDRREARVVLSPAGIRTLDQAIPLWRKVQHDIYDRLGATGAAELEALLGAL
jgi:DNA-binding MarR family transcriptional regulator